MKKSIVSLVVILFVCSMMIIACGKGKEAADSTVDEIAASAGAELTAKWESMSAGVPQMMKALQSRVDILSQSPKLPASISAEAFNGVKGGLGMAKDEWAKAEESFKAGNVADAVTVGTAAKDKLVSAMETLGMTVPAGMK
ncbi:MAG: hypothetical protein JW914_05875 [Syntrophaceae bacterium]|nr:hypothetical protein [Syntrophaceae bacterium]